MGAKTFKTLEEQIEILQNKGLIIDDVEYTKNILLRENYFFISGYRHLFIKSENDRTYLPGTDFKELYSMFDFDRQIRNIIFKNLLIIENNIKSIFSYELSKKYGYKEQEYLRPSNFTRDAKKSRQVNDLIRKMKRQIRINGNQHAATSHYINNYGYIPMWIVVKVLSFGIVSELYSIMKPEDQKSIADIYGFSPSKLIIFLPVLANFRNLCAHEDILYEHKAQRCIEDCKYHEELNIPKVNDEYIYGKNDLFSVIIIMKYMLRDEEFRLLVRELSYEIDILAGRLHTIPITKVLDKIGFPTNYKDIINLE